MIISIIGGGATGCAVLIGLIREFKKNIKDLPPIKINIFEPKNLGEGLAYAKIDKDLLLNTSICSTSIIDGDHFHFFNWLKKNESLWRSKYPEIKNYNEDSFMPRSLAGLYIRNVVEDEISSLKHYKISVNHIKQIVNDISLNKPRKLIVLHTRKLASMSDICILCTGYLKGLPEAYQNLKEEVNYFPSPYVCFNKIKNIPIDKRILIIGSRLSAIDAAILLRNYQHVVMASRSGYLPAVRNRLRLMPAKHLTHKYQEQFFKIHKDDCTLELIKEEIEKELRLVFNKNITLDSLIVKNSPLDQLKEDMYLAKYHVYHWEDSMMTFIDFINKAWNYLSLHDKKKLLSNEMAPINRYISAFPSLNAKLIYTAMKKGNLTARKGLKHIVSNNGKFIATFEDEKGKSDELFDYVINSTSAEKNLKHLNNKFYRKLSNEGVIEFNDFGGIITNSKFQVINNVIYYKSFYAAGPIIKGTVLITNFMLSSARQAHIIAKSVFTQIMNRRWLKYGNSLLYRNKAAR